MKKSLISVCMISGAEAHRIGRALESVAEWTAEMEALRKELPAGATRRAKGFEAAFFFEVPQMGVQLHVLTAQQEHVMVSVGGFGGPARTTAAVEQIARKALGRL